MALPQKWYRRRDKLILGARAPLPAGACAARSISTFLTLFSCFALRAHSGRGRSRSQYCFF